ncbi:hypothetical protein ACLKA7_001117 [Drosophila subpalustris]
MMNVPMFLACSCNSRSISSRAVSTYPGYTLGNWHQEGHQLDMIQDQLRSSTGLKNNHNNTSTRIEGCPLHISIQYSFHITRYSLL